MDRDHMAIGLPIAMVPAAIRPLYRHDVLNVPANGIPLRPDIPDDDPDSDTSANNDLIDGIDDILDDELAANEDFKKR